MKEYTIRHIETLEFMTIYGYDIADAFDHRPDLIPKEYRVIDTELVRG